MRINHKIFGEDGGDSQPRRPRQSLANKLLDNCAGITIKMFKGLDDENREVRFCDVTMETGIDIDDSDPSQAAAELSALIARFMGGNTEG